MIKFYKKLTVITLVIILGVVSCDMDPESVQPKKHKKKWNFKENNTSQPKSTISENQEYVEYIDTLLMNGYLGESKITVELISDGLVLNGSYFYNKYKTPITLSGSYEEGADWGPMSLTETDKNGEITGAWQLASDFQRLSGVTNGYWTHPKTGQQLPIVLYDEVKDMYLDDDSKMMFKSESEAASFFKKHQFLNHETYNKPGYIIADNYEEQYENPLPVGITIWSAHSYYFNEDAAYTLLEGGKVESQSTGEIMDLAELTESNREVDYEIDAFRFQFINNDREVVLENSADQLLIRLADLEEYGYHIIGEGQWFKNKSGEVMGYFSTNSVNYFDKEETDARTPIFEKPDITSSIILADALEELGYFSVLDVKLVGVHYWANVRFDYHSEVPCDGAPLSPKPSVTGWIRFFNDSRSATLGYYTRGC